MPSCRTRSSSRFCPQRATARIVDALPWFLNGRARSGPSAGRSKSRLPGWSAERDVVIRNAPEQRASYARGQFLPRGTLNRPVGTSPIGLALRRYARGMSPHDLRDPRRQRSPSFANPMRTSRKQLRINESLYVRKSERRLIRTVTQPFLEESEPPHARVAFRSETQFSFNSRRT